MVRGGRAEAPAPRSDVSFRLYQKTGNFKTAIGNRAMQWSVSTEEKQKNYIAQIQFHLIKTITIMRASVTTYEFLPAHQRCTGAKDAKLRGGHD
jgi:hypothetical protein